MTNSPDSSQVDPADVRDEDNSGTVKLRYYGTSWDVVFRDVAKATNSRLVGTRFPTGRFSRNDSRLYTRAEAVRIINKEIQSRGYRLVEQDDLLIVMDIPSLRLQYQPAVINNPSRRPLDEGGAPAEEPVAVSSTKSGRKAKRDPSIRKAQHELRHADHSTDEEAADDEATAVNDPRTVVVFRSRHRPVLDISREIYQAYPQHAELLSARGDGLPSFRVRQPSGKSGKAVQFDVTIDAENEEVRLDARKSQSASLLKLFRALDVSGKSKQTRRLMAQSPAVCRIADQLVPELEALRQKQPPRGAIRQTSGNAEEDEWLAEAEGDRPPSAEDEPREEPEVRRMLPQDLSDVIGNLKGEVTIESFEDLGALILKGAAEDVERVMDVIEQLEKLSEATAPRVHLLNLNHVDSRALAELLSSVYERLTKFPGRATQPRENVAILSITKPNAVLIVAPAADLQSIIELAEELDQPVDPLTEFQVFPLKTAVASQVETLITEFYEDREGLDTRILIRAEPRSNSVIIRARPRDLDEVSALIKKIDRESSASVSQVRIFHLKSASAQELATILNSAIQGVLSPPSTTAGGPLGGGFGGPAAGGGQVDEKFRDVKSTVLQFLAVDDEGQQLLRSGMLADIRITPDARMNALMVTAPERSMKLIEELINQLDRPSAAIAEIKVFPLTNADATKVVQQLQSLFSPQGQQQGGFGNQQRQQQLGIQVVGAEDAGSGLIPLRFSVDTRTNSIIAIGGAEALGIVEAILLRLDEGDIRERQQAVYRLKNSPATAIANAVTQFLTNQQELVQRDQDLVSSVEQLEREVIVVAEPVSNSLLISATPRYFGEIQRLIRKLDEPPAQVVIQALLVEVTLDNADEFGIEFGFQNSVLFDRSVKDPPTTIQTTTTAPNGTQTTTQQIISQTATPGFNFANPAFPLGNNISTSPSQVGLQSLSNFSVSRVNGDLGFGGLVLSAGSDTVNMLLRALSYSRRIQVLSRPQIRTLDNQTATIIQGSLVPVVNGVQISGNGLANPQVIQQEAGIILTVTPRISPDGQIVMDLIAERSSFRTGGVPIFTDGSNGNVIESPIKDLSNARAVVSVPNNQTVVFGGLITSSDDRVTRKVPGLGDLPLLGYLFRYDNVTTNRKELLIFLTPRLIREDADSEMIKEVEMARMHFIETEAEEVHGPLHGIPEELPILDQEGSWLDPQIIPPLHGAPIQSTPLEMPKPIQRDEPQIDEKTEIIKPDQLPAGALPDSRRLPSKSSPSIQQATHESLPSQTPADSEAKTKKKPFIRPRGNKRS